MSDPLGGLSSEPEPPRAEAGEPQRPRRPFTPATFALLGVFAAFFAAEGLLAHDWSVSNSAALIRLGALFTPALRDGDWWRLGSYAFLHIGWAHILANGWSLWVLAPQLEMTFGSNLTLGLFAATALAGGAASAAWNLHLGHVSLAAGASGGLMGLFGSTAALFWRIRESLSPDARSRIVRAIGVNVLLIVGIAYYAPVDNAAHAGGAIAGIVLGLLGPLPMRESRPWHRPVQWFLVGSALLLAAMEGAAFARAVKPRPRTLHAAGLEAQVPGLFIPLEPGLAGIPGEAMVEISKDGTPLQIVPGDDAVRIGDRTWIRERAGAKGAEIVRLAASDATGRVLIELWCNSDFCRGPNADRIYEQVARTVRIVK